MSPTSYQTAPPRDEDSSIEATPCRVKYYLNGIRNLRKCYFALFAAQILFSTAMLARQFYYVFAAFLRRSVQRRISVIGSGIDIRPISQ
jgi:hypothetical protein